MGQHLTDDHAAELVSLLLSALGSQEEATKWLRDYSHALRAKPLDLMKRDTAGVERVLAYLRMAV